MDERDAASRFYHHLRDTIILLGGGTQIANLAAKPGDICHADVEQLTMHNARLVAQVKDRLVNLNALTIQAGD